MTLVIRVPLIALKFLECLPLFQAATHSDLPVGDIYRPSAYFAGLSSLALCRSHHSLRLCSKTTFFNELALLLLVTSICVQLCLRPWTAQPTGSPVTDSQAAEHWSGLPTTLAQRVRSEVWAAQSWALSNLRTLLPEASSVHRIFKQEYWVVLFLLSRLTPWPLGRLQPLSRPLSISLLPRMLLFLFHSYTAVTYFPKLTTFSNPLLILPYCYHLSAPENVISMSTGRLCNSNSFSNTEGVWCCDQHVMHSE